uniref:AAA+ ATPase domain-containing protein n=1 Tax=Aplanochytrium stocchinoi TaxID=215587 RepID=A0A7S3PDK0_9STRA
MEMSIINDKPDVHWDDIAGLKGAKRALQECVLLPAKFPNKFTGIRQPWRGILLYGPPGTGKSFLAKALATEAESTFISVDSAAIMSKWQGESPKQVKELFWLAHKRSPSVIFIDEIDSLVGARGDNDGAGISQVKTQFMIETQSLGKKENGVLLLGATNLPWNLDVAILRRFEKRIYVPLPDKEARMTLFKLKLSTLPNAFSDENYQDFANQCQGYSGSDIDVVIKEAAYQPMRECHQADFFHLDKDGNYSPVLAPCPKCPGSASVGDVCSFCEAIRMSVFSVPPDNLKEPDVSVKHVFQALKKINPATGKNVLDQYDTWTNKFGESGIL